MSDVKRATTVLILLAATLGVSAQSVLFVKKGGQGNGQSWQTAIGNLQQALQVARAGQQIWVAAGEYYPTQTNDRYASFVIPDGVALYGGFSGTEQSLSQRALDRNPTILSGHIGSPAMDDNSLSVIRTYGVSSSTIVDGFIITGGNANLSSTTGSEEGCGGAWFNDGSQGKKSSPTVRNCVFEQNEAQFGGAIFNHGERGICRMAIQNCTFRQNKAGSGGGALYNSGLYGICNTVVTSCNFVKNEAPYGASIQNRADGGIASPMLRDCAFRENIAHLSGSSIYNYRSDKAQCRPVLNECTFKNNKDGLGDTVSDPVGHKANPRKKTSSVIMRPTY